MTNTTPKGEYWFEEGCFILELHNTADDPALSVARARVPVGGATRRHRLSGVHERYVILEGTGLVRVGEAAERVVRAQDVVEIPAGVDQSIRNTGNVDLVFLALCTPRFQRECYADSEPPAPDAV